MTRTATRAPLQRQLVVSQLIEEGWSRKEIAKKLGISPATVSRDAGRAARWSLPPGMSPRGLPEDPVSRLEAIRDGWLTVVEKSQRKLIEEDSASTQLAVIAGIGTQRALECHERLSEGAGLPDDLPDDDDEKRAVVLRAWWQAARRRSPSAIRQLAEALGLKTASEQDVELYFERPTETEETGASASASPVSAARPRA